MAGPIELPEQRVDRLRAEVRHAAMAGDRDRARALRAELRAAEGARPAAAHPAGAGSGGAGSAGGSPVRDRVRAALTLLGVPAAGPLILGVHDALIDGDLDAAELTGLRERERRAFAAGAHPWYVCAALTADRFTAARGLYALSGWPFAARVVGPLSARVDFLTAAVRVAGQVGRRSAPGPAALRLLWRFAANIPGAADSFDAMRPAAVARAADAELSVHRDADRAARERAATAAGTRLTPADRLFGAPGAGLAAEPGPGVQPGGPGVQPFGAGGR